MQRRQYIGLTVGSLALAGCLGGSTPSGGGGGDQSDGGTDAPENYLDKPKNPNDPEAVSFPVYGEQLPEVTMTDAIRGEEVTTTQFDTAVLMTFIYGNCQTVCPRLTSTLKNIQADSIENGYADQITFIEVTFDPKRDTPEALREHANRYGVDLDVGNWYSLRPESTERAKEVVQDTYGVFFSRTEPENMDMYMFNHLGLILLANWRALVERTYPNSRPVWQDVRDDLTRLLESKA
jgi:protein SCO1/2